MSLFYIVVEDGRASVGRFFTYCDPILERNANRNRFDSSLCPSGDNERICVSLDEKTQAAS